MARTRSADYPEVQRAILMRAARRFATQGYARCSISDLAAACGVSRGALYHYFKSKEAILFGILDAHIRELIAEVERATAAGEDPEAQARAFIRTMVEFNARSQAEQTVLLNDLSFLSAAEQQAIKALERRLVTMLGDLLVRLDGAGRITRRTRKAYAMMLFGVLNWTYTWYDPKGPVPPAEYAEMAAEVFLHGFAAPALPRRARA
jgi:AcrR family transcriptional regulator